MGRRGPPKKPTALKLVQGVPGGLHKLNANEPMPDPIEDITPPSDLSDDAKAIWNKVAAKLEKSNLLTEIDVNTLSRYCDMYVKWLDAKRFLDANGFYYAIYLEQTPEEIAQKKKKVLKYMAQFPQVSIYTQLGKDLTRIEQQFGMTPASRAGLNLNLGDNKKGTLKSKLYGS